MARLPTPGADANSWGSILNDFLTQAHNADGTVKDGVISASQLQDGSIGAAKLAADAVVTNSVQDGAITASKLAPGVRAGGTDTGIRSLLIYYAPPNVANARYDDNYAAGVLSRYDDVVLGSGLEDSGNVYHASTVAIIAKIAALSPETVVWGYIDCGVSSGNFSLATLQSQIDKWVAIGAKGIFCDLIGYAYLVPRSRQNAIITYIHSKNVGALLNVYNPDEVLSANVDVTYNPTGVASVANSSDVLLLESWICNSDAFASPYYAAFGDIKTRGDKAVAYRTSMGIRLFAVNILSHNDHTFEQLQEYHDYAEAFARVWRLDGSGMAASEYAASGADVGLMTPQFSAFKSIALRPTAPYILNGGWTEVQAPDLGITVRYDAGVHTWQQR
jgi:hypothetical protein